MAGVHRGWFRGRLPAGMKKGGASRFKTEGVPLVFVVLRRRGGGLPVRDYSSMTSAFSITTGSTGTSAWKPREQVRTLAISSTTSSPLVTRPKTA